MNLKYKGVISEKDKLLNNMIILVEEIKENEKKVNEERKYILTNRNNKHN